MSHNRTVTKQLEPCSDWDLRKYFEQLRFNKNHHLGLGDIRLTISQQDELCELIELFYQKKNKFL